ncbi:MAG: hypothetical protein KJ995_05895 [Candidatus Omnitrophica bacterium]|nr:hypothetical protein [Candidatus Omnitrophota bacterium]MBU1128926.1 hypothetical protein [Candidatus Omnitrophota bacterium]MBU1656970.1 hypothetical protein [Candidatus Omnitrophota bacterium]MBU1785097.1 hypothetical protein [Candidatus Omnitrophota bacterium]MBU1851919.1 hypothetical protein [Candidatus Omnitrophota bacterium]
MSNVRCAIVVFFVVLMFSRNISAEEFMTDSGDVREDMGDGEYMTESGEVREKESFRNVMLDDGEMEEDYGTGSETIRTGDIGQTQDGIDTTDNERFGQDDLERLGE